MDIVDRMFSDHQTNQLQWNRFYQIRESAKDLAVFISDNCPPSNEKDLALTSLDQAVMWAIAAITRNEQSELLESDPTAI